MTPEQAKDKMEEMARKASGFWLPEGFKVAIYVPKEIADKTREYYNRLSPMDTHSGPFAAGEIFYYQGIKCFASEL